MTYRNEILARFAGEGIKRTLFLPDLTLWYDWHIKRRTLPQQWKGFALPQIARAMGVPVWLPIVPYRVETPGVEIEMIESQGERVVRTKTSIGTLIARWSLGPDGDWWQVEYPVKAAEDLEAVLQLVNSRTYILNADALVEAERAVGDDGVVAIEIPRRPYSDVLHEFLGWSDGLLFLNDPTIEEIISILETKLQRFVGAVAQLPGRVVFSPDNLDGQFVSPRAFGRYLAESYRKTARTLAGHEKRLLIHVGGPIRHLVHPLTQAGVAGLEGIAGPPQGDLSLSETRQIVGPDMVLWGGIPQDYLLDTHELVVFEQAVTAAVGEAKGDTRVMLGVADRVPVNAELSRLQAIPELVDQIQSSA
jgi:hypothetical protein